jgi:beta-glucanase (GH16 family)
MLSKTLYATTVALAATLVSAQTHTDCDPTKQDCPNPKALGSKIVDGDFRKGNDDFIKVLAGTTLEYDKELGAVYTINKESEAPTVASKSYIFFGQVDVTLKAAPGKGIVTSVVLQSDDLDEIDWEWVGSDNTQVQTNYFSKGCTEVYDRGGYSPVTNPVGDFHTYTIKWTRERLDWIIDGAVVRTLLASNAKGCSGFPQSPMQVKLGTWVAGKPSAAPGTIEWAGGLANFADAPFKAYYKSIKVQDFMGGGSAKEATEYQYTDRSGTWQSIKVVNDGKAVDDDKSTTTSSGSTTKSTTKTTGSATTLSTVTPSSSGAAGASTTPTGSGSGTTPTGASNTTGAARTSPTSAAGKVSLSLGLGAALLFFAL